MKIRRPQKPVAVTLTFAIGLSGCATIDKTLSENNSAFACGVGGIAGALTGAVAARIKGEDPTKLIVAGAVAGCIAGLAYKARVDKLKAIAEEEGLKLQISTVKAPAEVNTEDSRESEVGIAASVESSAMFASGSHRLTPDGERQVRKMASVIAEPNKGKQIERDGKMVNDDSNAPQRILVVGHTDSTGSGDYNQALSERRARSVAVILEEQGIWAKNIYFQGAGSSKPVADNATEEGRGKNRRVEIIEVTSDEVLAKIAAQERNNPKYLAHGTKTTLPVKPVSNANKAAVKPRPMQSAQASNNTAPSSKNHDLPAGSAIKLTAQGSIDFGGSLVTTTSSALAQSLRPKPAGFSIISEAVADQPVSSCLADLPRNSGEIKNLATGKPLDGIETGDYMIGMNGHYWLQKVNGHTAAVGPVSILKEGAQVAAQPGMQFFHVVGKSRKETPLFKSYANTYEGDGEVLYRIFAIDQSKSPVSCADIIFDTRTGTAKAGQIFYPKKGDAFVADYIPLRK